MRLIDPDLLKTFVAFAETGSLSRAAEIVARTPSAVTAQMQRLEETLGVELLRASGRQRVLTRKGEAFLGNARMILNAHRDAWLNLHGAQTKGHVTVGATQDFSREALPETLQLFSRSFGQVSVDLRVGRSEELTRAYENGHIDVLLAMRLKATADEVHALREPMIWLSAKGGLVAGQAPLPLCVLDAPCNFRTAATATLDSAGQAYRMAATSASLEGLMTAVRAGLAVTLRTRWSLSEDLQVASSDLHLPSAGEAEFSLRCQPGADAAARNLCELLAENL